MKIICTICSNSKNTTNDLLPAYLHYTSPRITTVKKIADNSGNPFYILSGKYGLLEATTAIPYYDHLLIEAEVAPLSKIVAEQLQDLGVHEIDFYTKPQKTEGWTPYCEVLKMAASQSGVCVTIFPI
jgi:hypothetical protein